MKISESIKQMQELLEKTVSNNYIVLAWKETGDKLISLWAVYKWFWYYDCSNLNL